MVTKKFYTKINTASNRFSDPVDIGADAKNVDLNITNEYGITIKTNVQAYLSALDSQITTGLLQWEDV